MAYIIKNLKLLVTSKACTQLSFEWLFLYDFRHQYDVPIFTNFASQCLLTKVNLAFINAFTVTDC